MIGSLCSLTIIHHVGVVENDDSNANSEADEFVPRSPVPLPDVSSCRPILVQLGFSLSKKEKKGIVWHGDTFCDNPLLIL